MISQARSPSATRQAIEFTVEDNSQRVDGVVANQCLMASLGFAEGYYTRARKRPVARREDLTRGA